MLPMPAPQEIPEWLRPAMGRIVDVLPESCIREIGRHLTGGFTKRSAIVAQWRRVVSGNLRIPTWLAGQMREGLAPGRFFQRLDPAEIPYWIAPVLDLAGGDAVAVSLWLDPRTSVSALAQSALAERIAPELDAAVKRWQASVHACFLEPFGVPAARELPAPPAATSESPTPAVPAESVELEHLRKRTKEARAQLDAANQVHQREIREARERHQAELAAREKELASTRIELSALRSRYVTQLQEELASALDAQMRPWLPRAIELESQAAAVAPEFDRLMAEASSAFVRQQQSDRHQGNRTRLRQELERLAECRERARVAAGDALQPLGEWAALIRRLDGAIAQRRGILGDLPAAAPNWMPDLAADLAVATDPAAVDGVLRRAEALAVAGLLTPEILSWFRGRVGLRRSALIDPLRKVAHVPVPRIGDVLRGTAAGVILIDAYNWIGRAGEELGVPVDPVHFPESLRLLHPLLRRLAERVALGRILLIADGRDSNHRDLASNVRIVWSGGDGRDRADAVIIGELRHLRGDLATPAVFVVSDDKAVGQQAAGYGAIVEDAVGFARRVRALLATGSGAS
jgi:hypothetical protein